MSKRISKERAKQLRKREMELQQMQKDGIALPQSDRRRKKYLMRIKKEKSFLSYLKARYKKTEREDLAKKIDDE